MKLEVIEKGVYDEKNNRIAVGETISVKGDEIPGWLVNKVRPVAGAQKSKTPVTNPKDTPAKTVQELLDMASDADVHFSTFKVEAAKLLGDDTPPNKEGIVTKLEELATTPE